MTAQTPFVLETKNDDVDPVEEIKTALAGLTEDVATKTAPVSDLTTRLEAIETKLSRPNGNTEKAKDSSDETKAFTTYLRYGSGAPSEELKALTVANDEQGGYLAPEEMSDEFIRNLVEFSPVRSVASVRNIGGQSVKYPKRNTVTNAQWESENEDSEESTPTFGQIEVSARKLMTYVDISNELLADSAGVAEQEVRLALAEDFGKKEGTSFVNGDGTNQPEGFMDNADVAEVLNGHATVLDADQLISLMYDLPAAYRNNGTWAMNGTTLSTLRKLKDDNGQYLWQPSLQAGQPETILGRPVIEMVDMDDVAADAFPIAFGDFNRGYRIVDRLAMSILVNPYLLATKGVTRIHATRRVGGKVIQAAALRKLKMATS